MIVNNWITIRRGIRVVWVEIMIKHDSYAILMSFLFYLMFNSDYIRD